MRLRVFLVDVPEKIKSRFLRAVKMQNQIALADSNSRVV